MKYYSVVLLCLISLLTAGVAEAKESKSIGDINVNQLDNGLKTIVIRNKNRKASNEVNLSLVIKAGSLQEQDDELGYAHFVEHMAFNGTRDYPKDRLRGALSGMGLSLGQHSNATTHFDHTEYHIRLNTTDRVRLEKSLELLAQWAMHLSFQAEEVDKERAILLEEWQSAKPTERSVSHQFQQALYKGSRLLKRMPVGTQEGIKTASAGALKAFYQRWYRPDNAAVIVSGDIDVPWISQQLREKFGPWPAGKQRPKPLVSNLNPAAIPDYLVLSGPNMIGSEVNLVFIGQSRWPQTLQQRSDNLSWQLALEVLQKRLQKEVLKTRGKVLRAGRNWQRYTPDSLYLGLTTRLGEADYPVAMDLLASELAHFKQSGITRQELDTERRSILAHAEQRLDNSRSLMRNAVEHVLYGWPLVTQAEWLKTLQQDLPALKVTTVNQAINRLLEKKPRIVIFHNQQLPAPDPEPLQLALAQPAKKAPTKPGPGTKPEFWIRTQFNQ